MNISEGRKPYHGVNGVLIHNNIWCDTYLGLGICAIIRMNFDCIACINSMDFLSCILSLVPKDQTIYSSFKKRKYHPILGDHND